MATDPNNDLRLRKVLAKFGFGTTLPTSDKPLLQVGKVIMLGRSPLRIDIVTQISGVEFEEVFATRRIIEVEGLSIPVISPQTLLKNKQATGRVKDASDVIELKSWLDSQ